MKRRLTPYEAERLERMLESWVRSKQGSAVGSIAVSSAWADNVQGRSEDFQCRMPVLQADADLIDELVDGRLATQLRPAVPRMPDYWREPLRLVYLEQMSQRQVARTLKIAPQTFNDRLRGAKVHLAKGVFNKCDLAETRASA